MSDEIMNLLSPVVLALIGALVSILLLAVAEGKKHVVTWFKQRSSAETQKVINSLSIEAMAYAEVAFAEYSGPEKLQKAIDYVAKELNNLGLEEASSEKIIGTVQKAWMDYNKSKSTTTTTTTDVQPNKVTEVKVEEPTIKE